MPGTVLGLRNIAVNKIDKISCPQGTDIPVEGSSPALDEVDPPSLGRGTKGGHSGSGLPAAG